MNKSNSFANKELLLRAVKDSFVKLSPRVQFHNPVMFLVYISAIMTAVLYVVSLFGIADARPVFILMIAVLLWFTVLFANFAEAIAEGRGKAQADTLRAAKRDTVANVLKSQDLNASVTQVKSVSLKKGDYVLVRAGEQIPGDGEVVEGVASVDESAITGESAPVVRESGGDRSAVTGGTMVISDWLIIQITSDPGQSFLDKMIAMVEGAARKKTPNEIALQILLVSLSIIFLVVTVMLYSFGGFSARLQGSHEAISITRCV